MAPTDNNTNPSLRPPFGWDPLEFGDKIWHQKTRIMGYQTVQVS